MFTILLLASTVDVALVTPIVVALAAACTALWRRNNYLESENRKDQKEMLSVIFSFSKVLDTVSLNQSRVLDIVSKLDSQKHE